MYTHLEDYIFNLYKTLSIDRPHEINMANIARELKIKLHYANFSMCYESNIVIKKSTKQKEWQLFGHELCHYLRHSGNQRVMYPLFIELQENQANYFAYHFCIPTFMLEQLKEVNACVIMEKFNVEYDFALRRLEMYRNKQLAYRRVKTLWMQDAF